MDATTDPAETVVAESIHEMDVSYGSRDCAIRKLARKISIPYEVIRFNTMSFVAISLQQFGIKLGGSMNSRVVDRLVNGD